MHLSELHVVIVHFPIAFAIGAVAADFLWLTTRRATFRQAGLYCLVAALITALPTVSTGGLKADSEAAKFGEKWGNADLAERHEHFAFASLAVIVGATAVRLVWMKVRRRRLLVIYGAAMVALLVLISVTGDLGGQLVHGRGFLNAVFRQ
jgi:uncharacterized membrane protein